ncbi:hypothetical protein Psi02_32790 [Planotetraspora silvatica]|uniref:Uncharacterized protein n=1 Tax=Planotetraspora silvatica TaxID=234614 RepID=A0A8J3ULY1_9ACTN|nr:hypothetical protein Psi02_32790 [Planotetraspora silvatica]
MLAGVAAEAGAAITVPARAAAPASTAVRCKMFFMGGLPVELAVIHRQRYEGAIFK